VVEEADAEWVRAGVCDLDEDAKGGEDAAE